MLLDDGPVRIAVPLQRDGAFAPILIQKNVRRFTGFDDKIVAMYDRSMTVRAEVSAWRRWLKPLYPIILFDALRIKIRDDGAVRNQAVYVALGVLVDGSREVLGLWIEQTEGAKF